MSTPKTVVEYYAEHERYKCGYCGNKDTNYSHGMWAHSMTVQDYQDLLDRGWRRSGKYCYKPTMDVTCCPLYTIRCDVLNFKLKKSHKKVLKKMNKYLIDGIKPSNDKDDEEEVVMSTGNQSEKSSHSQPSMSAEDGTSVDNIDYKGEVEVKIGNKSGKPGAGLSSECGTSVDSTQDKTPRKGEGPDPSKPPCKKAKDRRKEKKLAKLAAKGEDEISNLQGSSTASKVPQGKTLEDFLSEPSKAAKCAHKLEIRLVRSSPRSKEFEDSLQETHNVYHRYQMAIHGDPPDKPNMRQFTRFLIDSPLEEEHPGGTLPMGYGSFHQQYILDGKIICVGVIDILPSLVSSKYLYYDPDYQFLSLGTYSALQEVAFVRELHKHSKEMLYYYMGFYVHSCPKMKYKGQYQPSYLLCPETYSWHPVEKCAPLLDLKPYCRFEEDKSRGDENGQVDLEKVLILYQRQMMTYPIYKALSTGRNDDEQEVKEYAGFIGRKCASSILLFRK